MSHNQTNQNQNQNQNYRNRRHNIKRFCAFLSDKSTASSKIGTLIKHTLPLIKAEVGAGIFIAFKNEQADLHFDDFLDDHPELAKMTSMGPGWYFWSFTQDATIMAKAMLAAAATKWDDDRRAFEEKKARERDAREKAQRDSKPIMVEDLPASAFPPLAPPAAKPVAAVWDAKGHAERKARADAPPAPAVVVSSFVPLTRRHDMFEAPQKKTVVVGGWEQDDE
jgi:hypothetical protein